jgi:2-methylisocitrate lyase-like PEP mutase family enzyme
MRERIGLPLIVDADTGFGNALNVQRTVRLLERAGATAIQLEDQTFPKRCGHLSNKSVVPVAEMVGKLHAALDARASGDTLIIARTDAIATDGLAAALDRAVRFFEAGADVIFVEAPRSLAEMQAVVAALGGQVPLLANMVEGGVTPILSCDELSSLGFSLAISSAALIRAQVTMTELFLASLKSNGSTKPYADRMLDFKGLNQRVGLEALVATAARYDESYSAVPAVEAARQ